MGSEMRKLYGEINELASRIESHWLKFNYSTDDFYQVAWDVSEGFDLSALGEVSNQLELLEEPAVRVQQHRSTFSDFHFQIFNNGRFLIEILNWWGLHVNVHDHDFSAVQFQLKGDALNVVYDFLENEKHGALRFGELKVRKAEVWKEGGRSIVRPGALDPHTVLHLGHPTTSLLIRTVPTARYGAQSNYFPKLAANYYVNSDIQRKKLTALSLLARSSKADFGKHFRNFVDTQSLSENFFMFLKLGNIVFSEDYVHLMKQYAARGDRESKLVHSVAFNNAIDFLKTKANVLCRDSESEKLAMFAIAAGHGTEGRDRIRADLGAAGIDLELSRNVESFLAKLSGKDLASAKRYLDVLGAGTA